MTRTCKNQRRKEGRPQYDSEALALTGTHQRAHRGGRSLLQDDHAEGAPTSGLTGGGEAFSCKTSGPTGGVSKPCPSRPATALAHRAVTPQV